MVVNVQQTVACGYNNFTSHKMSYSEMKQTDRQTDRQTERDSSSSHETNLIGVNKNNFVNTKWKQNVEKQNLVSTN